MQKGFTLIEILLSLALIAVVTVMGLPVYNYFQAKSDLSTTADAIVSAFRRAQSLAVAVDGDTSWGVAIVTGTPNRLVIFRGLSYGSRDNTYDEDLELQNTVALSGTGEVVFSKFYGLPTPSTGTIILTNTASDSQNIVFNEKGTLSY